jgi:hypothetical protein
MASHPASDPPPASASVPEVRAHHPQALLRVALEAAPEAAAAALATLGAERRALLAAAAPMDWIPVENDVAVVEAIAAQLPLAAVNAIFEARQRGEMSSSLLDEFLQTALRTFTASPLNLVKRIPTGWGRIFRNAGWVAVVSTGRNDAVLRCHRLPAPCIGSAPWMAALPVSLRVFYELVGVKGTVECRTEDAREGTALITFRWK